MRTIFWLLAALALPLAPLLADEPIKPPLVGLVDVGDVSFHGRNRSFAENSLGPVHQLPGLFGGVVINLTWAQLEPAPGELVTKEIDRYLEEIRAYNHENPGRSLGARLRVWHGGHAPAWAKLFGGEPIEVLHIGSPITVGRYWDNPYRAAWRSLQQRLAAKYDSEPLIREVTNSSGSSTSEEPFIVPGDRLSLQNLLAAGFNDRQFQETLRDSYLDYAGWKTTGIEWPISPYRTMDGGKPAVVPEFTLQMMHRWRELLGPRALLGNHSLANPDTDRLDFIYAEIKRLGPPSQAQTHSPASLDWERVFRLAVEYRLTSVEIWRGIKFRGFETQTPADLKRWAQMVEGNTPAAPKP